MAFLLDTNVCIEIVRGRNERLMLSLNRQKFEDLSICTVVWAELITGARLSENFDSARTKLIAFESLPAYPFDMAAAERYAEVRADLHRQGRIIGSNDLMIAAIALAHDLTLVTHNMREFSRVAGLDLVDWEI
jgi:tRNA(fMet)-specific endonuclease VapC